MENVSIPVLRSALNYSGMEPGLINLRVVMGQVHWNQIQLTSFMML